jgi:hypothetical protein
MLEGLKGINAFSTLSIDNPRQVERPKGLLHPLG